MFKLIMKRHTPKAMIEPFHTGPMTKLCYLIGDNAFLIQSLLSEHLKFVEIAIVLVLDMRMMNKLFPWFWHSWKANYTTDWGRTWTLLVASLHKSSLLMKHSLVGCNYELEISKSADRCCHLSVLVHSIIVSWTLVFLFPQLEQVWSLGH